jgi:Mn-dependent DtxR family transcriptional regulator
MTRAPETEPSEKMLEVLRHIIDFVEENGYQPSQAEMAGHFGVTKSAVAARLKGLAERGVVGLADGDRERAVRLYYVKYKAYMTSGPLMTGEERKGRKK